MAKLAGLLENANDFFKVAKICDSDLSLMIPEMVNISFACELYIKAIAEHKKVDVGKEHKLDKIFKKLPNDIQKDIYNIWRVTGENDIQDHPYYKRMFFDNLGACANVFTRFRYANEWAGSVVSLEHSYTPEQFEKYSPTSARRVEDILFQNAPQVYGGFINQFAKCLKTYAERLIGKTYNS